MICRWRFTVPGFSFGFVSGYLASGLALVAQVRAQGLDLETALQKLREDRARALGRDPATTDALFYTVSCFGEKPLPGYRLGSPTSSR